MAEENIFKRAGRRDWPFSDETGKYLDRLLSIKPFSEMDPQRRPKLQEILLLDTRVRTFKKGELIVRQGDYGTSAFMMLSGERASS
jgi:CRP-like cAMP-binding protein